MTQTRKPQPAAEARPMGGQDRWKSEDGTVELVATEHLFCEATDLFADLSAMIGPAGGHWQSARANRGEAIAMLAREVVGGRLSSLLVRVLNNTSMIVRGEGAGNWLLNSRKALDAAFTGRQAYVMPAVVLALRVSLGGFFSGFALIGFDPLTLTKTENPSSSEDYSPSTTDTD